MTLAQSLYAAPIFVLSLRQLKLSLINCKLSLARPHVSLPIAFAVG